MQIPNDFTFSQNNLQDYQDCPRRFLLRHIQHLEWPALQSEPVVEFEHHTRMGIHFHRLVHQSIIGFPVESLLENIVDPELLIWWENYQKHPPQDLPNYVKPEYTLSARINEYRITATFDLLSYDMGKEFVIVDWKTSLHKPSRDLLINRSQTRIYPMLLALAGAKLNDNNPPPPEIIRMIYWFVSDPEHPEIFNYSYQQYEIDIFWVSQTIREILHKDLQDFDMTLEEKKCRFCNYRSLCARGSRAGNWLEDEDPTSDMENKSLSLLIDEADEVAY